MGCGMKLNKTSFKPVGQYQVTQPARIKSNEPIVINKFGTLNTASDSATIEANEFTALDNTDIIDGYISRRPGSELLTPAKPDSTKILNFTAFQKNDSTVVQLRCSYNNIYRRGVSSWTALTGPALTGTDDDRFSFASSNDSFFAANGVNKVLSLNLTANTYTEISSSKAYKYIAAIGTRIVGANNATVGSPNPIEIGTSGNLNFLDWDPSSDFSAYRGFLYESQDDYADAITGLAGVGESAVVIRERTIWIGEPQPVAQQPFYFYPKILNIGSDTPNSVQKVYGGLCFADRRTNLVYYYDPRGSEGPTPISQKIINELNIQAFDPATIFSGWDPTTLTYVIGIPQPGTRTTYLWKYCFKTQGWTKDIYYRASCYANIPYSTSSITIDDIIGTIAGITTTINDISPVVATTGAQFVGTSGGDLYVRNFARDTDESSLADMAIDDLPGDIDSLPGDIDDLVDDMGGNYETVVVTKNFEMGNNAMFIRAIKLFLQPIVSGTISVSYSKDNGQTWSTDRDFDFNSLDRNKRIVKTWTKLIRARQIMFKFTSTGGLYKIVKFALENDIGGDIRE